MSTYKPTEHDGLKQDGTPDGRVGNNTSSDSSTSTSSSNNTAEDSTSSSGENYKPSEHGGLKKDGTPDKRTQPDHGFGGMEKEEVQKIASEGGKASGGSSE